MDGIKNFGGLYPWKRPHPGDYVRCEITAVNIQRGIIEVQLPEYGTLMGYIIFKHMCRRKIRNKSALGKIGQKFIGQVLSVGTGFQSVEISKIHVTVEKDKEVSSYFISLMRLTGFVTKITKEYRFELDAINRLTFYPRFLEFYYQVYGKKYNSEDEEEFTNDSYDDLEINISEDDDDSIEGDENSNNNHDKQLTDILLEAENRETVLKKIAEYTNKLFKGELDIEKEFKNLKSIDENNKFYNDFIKRIRNLIANNTFCLTWDIDLLSYDNNGVNLVSEFLTKLSNELKKNPMISKKCKHVSLKIVTPPQYQLTLTTKEDKEIITEVDHILNEIKSAISHVDSNIRPVMIKEI